MALYTKESVERAKEAVDMVELVGSRTDLRRVGARHTGLCPFHDERTPSFSVNADHGLYYCFGCGASGDAIGFVQATESLDFRGAVEMLADRYGVELVREQEDPREEERRRRRDRLLALADRAAAYYARYLWDSSEARHARSHLLERGLEEQVLRDFRVGYAPSAHDRIIKAAGADGYRPEEIAAAGLASRGRGGQLYDRFRARITFPLADPRGRVLGFGARASREGQQPKYLNSSENELYHKGRQLFGIDRARVQAAKAGRVVVVEGYTDVLALHQAGLVETVAIMGTALTQEQLAELARTASTVFLALDADRAGQEAMLRAARGAEDRGVELRVVALPEGSDPADLVAAEGTEAFVARLEQAMSVPEFEARRVLAETDLSSARDRDRALERLRPLVGATPAGSVVRDELVRHIADRLDVPVAYLRAGSSFAGAAGGGQRGGGNGSRDPRARGNGSRDPRAAGADAGDARDPGRAVDGSDGSGTHGPGSDRTVAGDPGTAAPAAPAASSPLDAMLRGERTFLAMCIAQGAGGRAHLAKVSDEHLSSAQLRRAREHLLSHFDDPLAELPDDDPSTVATLTQLVMLADEEPASEVALRLGYLQLELRRIERALRHAREARDHERQRALYTEREGVRAELDQIMGEAF